MMTTLSDFGINITAPVWNILVIVFSIVSGLLLTFIIHKFFTFYTKRNDYFFFKSIVTHLHAPTNFIVPLLLLNFAIPLMRLGDKSPVDKTIELSLLAAFSFLLIRIVRVVEENIYYKNDITSGDNLKARKIRTQIEFVSRMAIMLIVVLTFSAMLLSFENLRRIGTGMLASVGVGSIIIGFAAQSSLSNLLAGLQIAFTQPIRLDDVVVVEGEWGRIEDITLTYVVVRIWDERTLILPIRYFIEKPFQNWTRINADILGTVFLHVDYTLPIDALREKFEALLQETPLWDGKVNVIQVTNTTETTLEIRALMSARNSSAAFDLRCLIREHLITFIQENYPQCLPKTRTDISRSNGRIPEQVKTGSV